MFSMRLCASLEMGSDQLTRKLDPCGPHSADVLQQEAVTAENSCPQRLLEADANLNLRRRAQKSVPVNHVFVSRANFDRHNMARQRCGEGNPSRAANSTVLRHE